jgi:hypothetical protein
MMAKYNPGPKQVALAGQLSYAQTDYIGENCRVKTKARNAGELKSISGTERKTEGRYFLDVFRYF